MITPANARDEFLKHNPKFRGTTVDRSLIMNYFMTCLEKDRKLLHIYNIDLLNEIRKACQVRFYHFWHSDYQSHINQPAHREGRIQCSVFDPRVANYNWSQH